MKIIQILNKQILKHIKYYNINLLNLYNFEFLKAKNKSEIIYKKRRILSNFQIKYFSI